MADAKPRTVSFTGRPSTDDGNREFHFIVDRDTFVRVAGREPEDERDEVIGKGKYRLYPAWWCAANRGTRRVMVKLCVSPV